MKATEILEKQHRKVEALFKKLEGGRGDPEALVEELANTLAAHMTVEQELFYPAVKTLDEDLIMEAFEEHSMAELSLKRLLATDLDDSAFKARVATTRELIEHHVKEEEDDLFPKVEKRLGDEKLRDLGKAMKKRYDEVFEAGFRAAVPKGFSRTSADLDRPRARAKAA